MLVNGKTRSVTIKDVLYVPELSVNLLSMQKIAEKNFTVKFNKSICEIMDDVDNVIAKSTNNIYELL